MVIQKIKGFTLVELIIVITILAILSTIAFISFGVFTKNTRDSNRLASMSTIEIGLEVYQIQTGKYPKPEEYENGITYTGALSLTGIEVEYSYMGKIGEQITKVLKINEIPTDPKTGDKYIYATTLDLKKYQLAGTLETDMARLNIITQSYADNGVQKAKVTGNHKEDVIYDLGNTGTYYTIVPSMIYDIDSGTNILNSTGILSIVNKKGNIPYAIGNGKNNNKKAQDLIKELRGQDADIIELKLPSKEQLQTMTGGELINYFANNSDYSSGAIKSSMGAIKNTGEIDYSLVEKTIKGTVSINSNDSTNQIDQPPSSPLQDITIIDYNGGRRWSDGTYAKNCKGYINTSSGYSYSGSTGDGIYFIDTDGENNFISSNTKLFINSNSTNGNTIFVDSALGKNITTNGNAVNSDSKNIFGNTSIYFDGNGDYLSLTDSEDWNFGTGDFTIDFWMYPLTVTSGNYGPIIDKRDGNTNTSFAVRQYNKRIGVYIDSTIGLETGEILSPNYWYHIAIIRNGNNIYIYINGNLEVSTSYSTSISTNNFPLLIGKYSLAERYYNGYLQNIRITKGQALWTNNFTPSTYPVKVSCDMTTDGGGWTQLWNETNYSTFNYNSLLGLEWNSVRWIANSRWLQYDLSSTNILGNSWGSLSTGVYKSYALPSGIACAEPLKIFNYNNGLTIGVTWGGNVSNNKASDFAGYYSQIGNQTSSCNGSSGGTSRDSYFSTPPTTFRAYLR